MCGGAIAPAKEVGREERKLVTVLFTDLVGFTSQAEKLDPEDVRATLSPYYARLRAELERHGGTVEKFIGDAVMAVFGAPVAHEDDPERAVRAALAIRDAIDTLQIRTAVNTGEALVALGVRSTEGEGMVSGDVVNTTARLQAAAPVNGILVGEATYRATRDVIEYREAPPVDAKGKAAPVPAWEAVGARSRFGLDVEERERAPLVGRGREVGMLTDALGRCRGGGNVQLVTLVGVPGIGKSRLVTELFQVVDADTEIISWRQGRSLPYGETVSYWALAEIVKAQAGILETDAAESAAAKLAAMIETAVDDLVEREWVASHTRPLVGLRGFGNAEDRRRESFAAWRTLLERLAESRPLVLVFEDLHWADDGLLDFVDYLVDWAAAVPLLVVATARPELLERRPDWGGGKRNALTLSVAPLNELETAALLGSLLDQALLPVEVQTAVLERAQGNPLYAEEYVRMLQDRGFLVSSPHGWQLENADELPVPDSVQGIIAARIDALPAEEKALIQEAAVIGKVFWPGAVAALRPSDPTHLDERLHALGRKEFVRRDRRSAVAGETQYSFLHALVRDVAYGQIPRARRVDLHCRAAEWIEALAQDRTEDRAEMLAHHYRLALALAEAAAVDNASLREPARRAFAEAADRAVALNAWPAALELANEALALTDAESAERPALQLNLAYANWHAGRDDAVLIADARDGFLAHGDEARAAEAAALLARVLGHHGDANGARKAGQAAVDLARRLPVSPSTVYAIAQYARNLAVYGGEDLEQAVALAREARTSAEQIGRDDLVSHALNTIGTARVSLGDEAGVDDLEASLEHAKRASAVSMIGGTLNNLANALWEVGRLDEGSACIDEARALYLRHGWAQSLAWNDGEQVGRNDLHGDFDGVLDAAARFFAHPGAEERVHARVTWAMRARVLLARGEIFSALEDGERALDQVHAKPHDPQIDAAVRVVAARCFAAAGRAEEADALVTKVLTQREPPSDWLVHDLPFHLTERGRGEEYYLASAERRPGFLWRDAALALVSNDPVTAAGLYGRIGARFAQAWARLLAAEAGHIEQLAPAHEYFMRVGAAPYLERSHAVVPASA